MYVCMYIYIYIYTRTLIMKSKHGCQAISSGVGGVNSARRLWTKGSASSDAYHVSVTDAPSVTLLRRIQRTYAHAIVRTRLPSIGLICSAVGGSLTHTITTLHQWSTGDAHHLHLFLTVACSVGQRLIVIPPSRTSSFCAKGCHTV